ncbi:hypothetical protein BKA80DRAFT_276751 [Phyllosticta citrichinensis]
MKAIIQHRRSPLPLSSVVVMFSKSQKEKNRLETKSKKLRKAKEELLPRKKTRPSARAKPPRASEQHEAGLRRRSLLTPHSPRRAQTTRYRVPKTTETQLRKQQISFFESHHRPTRALLRLLRS